MREIFRRYARGRRVDRRARTVAHRAGRADQDPRDGLEQRDDLGDAPQPGLRRAGRLRQDARDRRGRPRHPSSAVAETALHPHLPRGRRAEDWKRITVPALISEEQFALAQERLHRNSRFSPRNTSRPSLLQGILVCRECGYAYYRCSTRSKNGHLREYYRCSGTDGHRRPEGRVCDNRPVRLAEIDELVWTRVLALLEDPALIHAEIDRRLRDDARRAPSHQRDETRSSATSPAPRTRSDACSTATKSSSSRSTSSAPAPPSSANARPPSKPSSTRSTPSCTTPRPTSSSPRHSTASAPASPTSREPDRRAAPADHPPRRPRGPDRRRRRHDPPLDPRPHARPATRLSTAFG